MKVWAEFGELSPSGRTLPGAVRLVTNTTITWLTPDEEHLNRYEIQRLAVRDMEGDRWVHVARSRDHAIAVKLMELAIERQWA